MVAQLIVRVIYTETNKMPEGEWSKAAMVFEDGGWKIPIDWTNEIKPDKDGTYGTLTLHMDRHFSRSESAEMRKERDSIIKDVLGWQKLRKKRAKSVMMQRLPTMNLLCGNFDENQMNALVPVLPDMVRPP